MTDVLHWRAWLRAHPDARHTLLQDALVAAAAFAAGVVVTLLQPIEDQLPGRQVAVALTAGAALPLALRRVAPWPAIALTLAGLVGSMLVHYNAFTLVITYILMTSSTAAHLPLRRALLAATVLWVPALLVVSHLPGRNQPGGLPARYLIIADALIGLVAFLVGRVVSTRRAYTTALEERAQAAESNQRALAEQAVADERRRIARELHDVVAHHVSVTGVLATGARRMLRRDPDASDEALATIEETSRTALREMRRLLTVLRTEAEPTAELAPQPDLAGINVLVDQIREAGLPVTLQVEGTGRPLDPGVALAIFRIVQEALTNTLKHAGPATAEVRLSFGVQWLVVEVYDTGRGPVPGGSGVGHGLVGMRERVALYGGTLRTGPRPGGGFRVYARIPMDALDSPDGAGPPAGAAGRSGGSGTSGTRSGTPGAAGSPVGAVRSTEGTPGDGRRG